MQNNNKNTSKKDDFFGNMLDGLDNNKDTSVSSGEKDVKNISVKANEKDVKSKFKNTVKKDIKETSAKASKKDSVISDILEEKSTSTFYKGIYFDQDVHQVIEEFISQSSKKNIRSFVVNKMLREIFKKKGLL
ncbi:hypothetical protein P6709_19525 [Jeotgalibacillus sp. ET6]|uniref:hypothetical protein n=1 Tax=Jeotgalibacillus sp. ET6 TaxID=3037260 RepID=UPI0024182AF3|nr:hypothetical protein [Jeotgalibacillus sp. ET6]MDG5473921.1 hypothetical protein [Jeotgalibacillus sp. ET6]